MIGVNMVFFMGGPQLGELEAGLVAQGSARRSRSSPAASAASSRPRGSRPHAGAARVSTGGSAGAAGRRRPERRARGGAGSVRDPWSAVRGFAVRGLAGAARPTGSKSPQLARQTALHPSSSTDSDRDPANRPRTADREPPRGQHVLDDLVHTDAVSLAQTRTDRRRASCSRRAPSRRDRRPRAGPGRSC